MLDQTIDDLIPDHGTYGNLDRQHRMYTDLRENDPVHWTEPMGYRPFWTITKYNDIMEIERQQDKFLAQPRSKMFPIEYEKKMAEATGGKAHFGRAISQMDQPDHRIFRGIANEWFMPNALERIRPDVEALAERSMNEFKALGSDMDFYHDVASPYPLRVIMLILGCDFADEPRLRAATNGYFAGNDPEMSGGMDIIKATQEYFAYFEPIAEERRRNPSDDVASIIANTKIDGEYIDDGIVKMYYVALAGAGHDTTGSTSAGGILAMMENPSEWDKLKADPELTKLAVEEMIRWVSPVKHFMRTAAVDYELRGKTIKAGDSLMLAYPSGNRDEDIFEDPFTFRIDRKPNRHMGFGFGPHICLGMSLARMELQIFFRKLMPLVKKFELTGEPRWTQTNFVGGLKHLPVHVEWE